MRRFRLSFAAAVLLAVAAPAAAANVEDSSINAVYARLTAARTANDVAGMAGAFGAGGLLVDSRPGPAISGAELAGRLQPMAERLRTEKARIGSAYRIERRSVLGDIALDAGFMRQTVHREGAEPMIRYARFLVTLQKDSAGQWRIIGDASMPATQAAFEGIKPTEGLPYDG